MGGFSLPGILAAASKPSSRPQQPPIRAPQAAHEGSLCRALPHRSGQAVVASALLADAHGSSRVSPEWIPDSRESRASNP